MDEINRFKSGIGSQAHPGRSCAQIIANQLDQPSHVMFIDPNEGSAKDALAVTCTLHTDKRISGDGISTIHVYYDNVQVSLYPFKKPVSMLLTSMANFLMLHHEAKLTFYI